MADIERVGGGTPAHEIRLEEKRRVLRRALKREYILQRFDPKNFGESQGKPVFDTAFARYNALHSSTDFLVKRNARNFMFWIGTFVIPVGLLTKYLMDRRASLEADIRAGKVPIDSPRRKVHWFDF